MQKSNRPEAAMINQIIGQLESFWTQGNLLEQQEVLSQGNALLRQFIDMSTKLKLKIPTWKTVFSKHLSSVASYKNKKIGLYYFKIASQLSLKISSAHLSQLLEKNPPKDMKISLKQLKIAYYPYNKESDKSFLQKITVKACQFVAFLLCQTQQGEDFFIHYLVGFTSQFQKIKQKIKNIMLAALDSYFVFCINNQNQMSQLKFNVFLLMNELIKLFKQTNQSLGSLTNCFHNFIALIKIQSIQNFVTNVGESVKVPEKMQNLISTICELQSNGIIGCQKLLIKLCQVLIMTKKEALYLNLPPFNTYLSKQSSKRDCIMSVLSFHSEMNTLGTCSILRRQQIEECFSTNLQFMFQHFKPEDREIILNNICQNLNKIIFSTSNKNYSFDIFNARTIQMTNKVKPYHLFKLYFKVVNELDQQSDFKKTIGRYYLYYFFILIFRFRQQPNNISLQQILDFFSKDVLNAFNQPQSAYDLNKLLFLIAKLCISNQCPPQFCQELIKNVPKFNLKYLIQDTKPANIFSPFFYLQNFQVQKIGKMKSIIVIETLQIYILKIIKSKNHFKDNQHWYTLQASLIHLLAEYYQWFEQQKIDEIIGQLCKTTSEYSFKIIKDLLANEIFQHIQNENFIKDDNYRQFLSNYIDLLKKILTKQTQIPLQDKLELIDLTFNIKSDLFSVFSRLKKENNQNMQNFIQNIIDSLDGIEQKYLGGSGNQFIKQLCILLQEDLNPSFTLLASASVKHIFSIIYPDFFVFQDQYSVPVLKSPEEIFTLSSIEIKFLQEEIEISSSTLTKVKNQCIKIHKIFERLTFLDKFDQISENIKIFTNITIDQNELQSLIFQVGDLMYITNLIELHPFKNLLISIQLSLINKYYDINIFAFEIGRYILLQILTPEDEKDLKQFLRLNFLEDKKFLNPKLQQIISLFLDGSITQEIYSQKRIFRLLTLYKTNSLCLINDFKSIIWSLTIGLFKFSYIPFDISQEKIMLKMSRQLNFPFLKKVDYWICNIWQHDWSFLRLLVLFIKKILTKVIELNQLSKIRSFLNFSLIFFSRSGHLGELSLPLEVALKKKREINLMHIADNLKKVVSNEINYQSYKKIDRILCNKRRSLSIGLSFNGLAKAINSSFEKAGKIGKVLCDIFMSIICQMLNISQWQLMTCKMQMSIYQPEYSSSHRYIAAFDQQTSSTYNVLQKINEFCQRLSQIIFSNYQHALIIKDYIGKFLNKGIQAPELFSPKEHEEIDLIIIKIALIFSEFNYVLKKFWSNNYFHISLSDTSITSLNPIQALLNDYSAVTNQYGLKIENKIKELKKICYPLSIIFPLGKYVFNIACKDNFLVTYISKTSFEDKLQQSQSIIKSNSDIMKQKDLNSSLNLKKRRGLDNQLGKVTYYTDVGIIDFDRKEIPFSLLINELTQIHPALIKFILQDQQDSANHLQSFIKRYRLGSIGQIQSKLKKINLKINSDKSFKPLNMKKNVIIYLHYQYLSFPFENTKSVGEYSSCYRIPSIDYLLQNQHLERVFNINFCSYLINTKKDLNETEIRFQNIRKKFNNWTGIAGRVPQLEEIVRTLLNKDMFLFMGHGTGLEHIPTSQYINFKPKCLMLVFGCSSSLMTFDASEPSGCCFDFLMQGCPGYLGCLWNVTDVDIDKITSDMLIKEGEGDFSAILSKCKRNISFPNLNGSAVVIYGLPSQLVRR